MSEQKRASLITVDGGKKSKPKVSKTIRLTIDLSESNENVYPQFNYRELIKAEEVKLKGDLKDSAANEGRGPESDPFFDNDDDVERIARQFEQKYGGSNTYGRRKNKTKNDDFADIGAGYDENDSFIDNTDGYDEMIPPEFDTAYGGFYINSGCLEFTNVPEGALNSDRASESDVPNQRKSTKRPLSSSESDDTSSDSSGAGSDSSVQLEDPSSAKQDNAGSENNTDGNKSSNETSKKVKSSKTHNAPKKRRKQSSDAPTEVSPEAAATSAVSVQSNVAGNTIPTTKTVRELLSDARNAQDASVANAENSMDSHTSDSAIAKPIPSSHNAGSSDSSCGPTGARTEASLPSPIMSVLSKLELTMSSNGGVPPPAKLLDPYLLEVETYLVKSGGGGAVRRAAYNRFSALCSTAATPVAQRPRRSALQQRGKKLYMQKMNTGMELDINAIEQRSQLLMTRLKEIIALMSPEIVSNYKLECQKIMETNKQIRLYNATMLLEELQKPERRLPKRRFPWNEEVRGLLVELAKIQGEAGSVASGYSKEQAAAGYLRDKVLPLFPNGFVRMPTLLQQARLDKNQKLSPDMLVGRRGPKPAEYKQNVSAYATNKVLLKSQSEPKLTPHIPERSISQVETGPASLQQKHKSNSELLASMNLPINTNVTIEKANKADKDVKRANGTNSLSIEKITKPSLSLGMKAGKTEETSDKYNPPNSIGSITITPLPSGAPKTDIKHHVGNLLNNSVTVISAGPAKSEQLRPDSDLQMRLKSTTYDNNTSTKVTFNKNGDTEDVKKVEIKKEEFCERANGVRSEKREIFSDVDSPISIKDESIPLHLMSDQPMQQTQSSFSQCDVRKDQTVIVKPTNSSKSYPEVHQHAERLMLEKSIHRNHSLPKSQVVPQDRMDLNKQSAITESYQNLDLSTEKPSSQSAQPYKTNFPQSGKSNANMHPNIDKSLQSCQSHKTIFESSLETGADKSIQRSESPKTNLSMSIKSDQNTLTSCQSHKTDFHESSILDTNMETLADKLQQSSQTHKSSLSRISDPNVEAHAVKPLQSSHTHKINLHTSTDQSIQTTQSHKTNFDSSMKTDQNTDIGTDKFLHGSQSHKTSYSITMKSNSNMYANIDETPQNSQPHKSNTSLGIKSDPKIEILTDKPLPSSHKSNYPLSIKSNPNMHMNPDKSSQNIQSHKTNTLSMQSDQSMELHADKPLQTLQSHKTSYLLNVKSNPNMHNTDKSIPNLQSHKTDPNIEIRTDKLLQSSQYHKTSYSVHVKSNPNMQMNTDISTQNLQIHKTDPKIKMFTDKSLQSSQSHKTSYPISVKSNPNLQMNTDKSLQNSQSHKTNTTLGMKSDANMEMRTDRPLHSSQSHKTNYSVSVKSNPNVNMNTDKSLQNSQSHKTNSSLSMKSDPNIEMHTDKPLQNSQPHKSSFPTSAKSNSNIHTMTDKFPENTEYHKKNSPVHTKSDQIDTQTGKSLLSSQPHKTNFPISIKSHSVMHTTMEKSLQISHSQKTNFVPSRKSDIITEKRVDKPQQISQSHKTNFPTNVKSNPNMHTSTDKSLQISQSHKINLSQSMKSTTDLDVRSHKYERTSSPIQKGIKSDQNLVAIKSDEITVKSSKHSNLSLQTALKLVGTSDERLSNAQAPLSAPVAPDVGLKTRGRVEKPKEIACNLLGEVPITGSVIVNTSKPNSNYKPDKAVNSVAPPASLDDSSSDVELIEEFPPEDPLKISPPSIKFSAFSKERDENKPNANAKEVKLNNKPSSSEMRFGDLDRRKDLPVNKDPDKVTTAVKERASANSDIDRSKHSSVVHSVSDKTSDRMNSNVKDDLCADPTEADINTVLSDIKELTNFHDNTDNRYSNDMSSNRLIPHRFQT